MEKQDPTQEITVGDIDYQAMEFAYEKRAEQDAGAPARHPVVVVGAGPSA